MGFWKNNGYQLTRWLGAFLAMVGPLKAQSEPTGAVLFLQYCAGCHGEQAQGREAFQAPPLAQMPTWYVTKQLKQFKAGERGSHPQDTHGAVMAVTTAILKEEMIEPLAAWIASQPRRVPDRVESVDLEIGETLYRERCMECHRYNAEGNAFFNSPPLAGLPAWYLHRQLNHFRAKVRGFAPDDLQGQKMQFNVGFIHSEAEQASLVAYILELQRKYASLEALGFGQD